MSTNQPPGDQRQLGEYTDDSERCEAYAQSTGERCRHDSMPTLPYCRDHIHLLDDVDLAQ